MCSWAKCECGSAEGFWVPSKHPNPWDRSNKCKGAWKCLRSARCIVFMRWKVGTGGEKEGNTSLRRKKCASIKTGEGEGLFQSAHWHLSTSYVPCLCWKMTCYRSRGHGTLNSNIHNVRAYCNHEQNSVALQFKQPIMKRRALWIQESFLEEEVLEFDQEEWVGSDGGRNNQWPAKTRSCRSQSTSVFSLRDD